MAGCWQIPNPGSRQPAPVLCDLPENPLKGNGNKAALLPWVTKSIEESVIQMSNDFRQTKVTSTQQEPERERRIFSFKLTQLILLFFGILEVMIALRIGLLLIGANPTSPIVAFIYGVTYLFLFPFTGLIGSPSNGTMVFELSSVFAMVIYALLAWIIERIVWVIFYRPRGQVVGTTQTTSSEQHLNP